MFNTGYRKHRSPMSPVAATPVPLDLVSMAQPTINMLATQVPLIAAACFVLLPIFIGIRLVPKLVRRFAR